jgi:hypothetical protein
MGFEPAMESVQELAHGGDLQASGQVTIGEMLSSVDLS